MFCSFAHYFKMYAVYLNNVEPCRRLLAQLSRRSRNFDEFIKQFEVCLVLCHTLRHSDVHFAVVLIQAELKADRCTKTLESVQLCLVHTTDTDKTTLLATIQDNGDKKFQNSTVLSSLKMRCEQSFVLSRPSFQLATIGLVCKRIHTSDRT